jgi:hypothetical protein
MRLSDWRRRRDLKLCPFREYPEIVKLFPALTDAPSLLMFCVFFKSHLLATKSEFYHFGENKYGEKIIIWWRVAAEINKIYLVATQMINNTFGGRINK